ncbi:MAG TPA: inositol monophosphatase [Pseudolabrys sp.]|nr:inositol monophosphatase [Pseudolabrys sp.]
MIDHHQPAADTLAEIEDVAVDLATLAGAEIERTLGAFSSVRYKTGAGGQVSLRDPVSEVDGRIEQLIRARLAEGFPDHDIIGEEMKDRLGREHEYLWAVDPIDGTTNFVNGFPIFAASIGVLRDGYPVAGAVWCSISHALRTGVYHARAGGSLRFERDQVVPKLNPAVQRRLAGVPSARISEAGAWDTRKTGSAAVECALVAAGLLEVARFAAPNIWDVAGGIALLRASGCAVHRAVDGAWVEMQRFEPMPGPDGQTDLRHWRNELVVGEPAAVSRMGRQARQRDTQ